MNPSADGETLSAAEVSKTNQVTVAIVTTTSTTNTQTVAGTGACYIPLCKSMPLVRRGLTLLVLLLVRHSK